MAAHGTTRELRERELVLATRALFDERGMQHAPIEEVAKAVGIARGLIYRVFSSKEELYVLTVTDYLDELDALLAEVDAGTPAERLERVSEAFARFCLRWPAFLDCSLSLMQRPANELHGIVSESVWVRLGSAMATPLARVSAIVRAGSAAGTWQADDPDYVANVLWTQSLGLMHLARIRVGVREEAPGVPGLFAVAPERVVASCVGSALALVGLSAA